MSYFGLTGAFDLYELPFKSDDHVLRHDLKWSRALKGDHMINVTCWPTNSAESEMCEICFGKKSHAHPGWISPGFNYILNLRFSNVASVDFWSPLYIIIFVICISFVI